MSTPHADPEETTLWSGSVSQWHYAGKWCFIVILIAALIATFVVDFGQDHTVMLTARIALAAIALIVFIWIRLDRAGRKYMITNKRVSVEYGIVSKSSNELRIQDIRSINLTTKGISGLLGIGRLEFSSAATDDADVIFWNTGGAEKLRDMVRGLQA